ncbi:MAG TPA: hypothetical protein VN083_11860 [Vicinamibacteria bacterium]|nr:hypothetical protein [Vicinamibacteria bacterium]
MEDEAYARYVAINLPHARTIVSRIARTLEALEAFPEAPSDGPLSTSYDALEQSVRGFEEDPPFEEALRAADTVADRGRLLAAAIIGSPVRGDRLGRHVRNLFECLGLAEEGATLSLQCGEDPESLLR